MKTLSITINLDLHKNDKPGQFIKFDLTVHDDISDQEIDIAVYNRLRYNITKEEK